jgi:hypothetical protein
VITTTTIEKYSKVISHIVTITCDRCGREQTTKNTLWHFMNKEGWTDTITTAEQVCFDCYPIRLVDGAIVEGSGIVYESDSIADLPVLAVARLVELCNDRPELDWDDCKAILIEDGLYTPESEADDV